MKAMHALHDSSLVAAQESLQRALELDPQMAPAHLRLALINFWRSESTHGRQELARALQSSTSAIKRSFITSRRTSSTSRRTSTSSRSV
jgi:Tfp pilus assembly protein PilF